LFFISYLILLIIIFKYIFLLTIITRVKQTFEKSIINEKEKIK